MTRINLLPPELRERHRARRQTAIVAGAGLVAILGLAFVTLVGQVRLSRARADLDARREADAALEADVAELRPLDDLVARAESQRELLALLERDEVQWSHLLRDVSAVIPDEAWLDRMNGTAAAPFTESGVEPASGSGLVGTLAMDGFADRHPTVADWLAGLMQVPGFVNPWITSSRETSVGDVPVVRFTSKVDLGIDATAGLRQRA